MGKRISFSFLGTVVFGAVVAGYGVKSIINQKIIASGNEFKPGWQINGDMAVAGGVVLVLFGAYIMYLGYKHKD